MKINFRNKISGLTLLEVCVVISIFFLFLIVFYATIDVGLKQWKMGETKADIQTTAQWVMKRLSAELENADPIAIEALYNPADPNDTTYLCFETPVYNGVLQTDPDSGDLHWQGHVLYFTLPDPDDKDYNAKILYRKFIPHDTVLPLNDRTITSLLDNITTYLNTAPPASPGTFRKICENITRAQFEHDGSMVSIIFEFQKNFRKSKDANVSFATGSDVGTDRFIIKNSIKPKD